jgi:DNA-binding transcriptional LysR family regulator
MLNRTPGLTFEIDHLRAFITLVDCGTQTKASKQLHITQPCLCKKLLRLQALVNVRLWKRARQVSFELTPAGHQFLEDARRIVGLVDDLANRTWSGANESEN